jgi:hypothetical protein
VEGLAREVVKGDLRVGTGPRNAGIGPATKTPGIHPASQKPEMGTYSNQTGAEVLSRPENYGKSAAAGPA